MARKIIFNPTSEQAEHTVQRPKPADEYLPDWYKRAPAFETGKPQFNPDDGSTNPTIKMCMPFLDSLSMGYIQETWCDIYIERKDGETSFYYPVGPKIMSSRENSIYPTIDGFESMHYVWHGAYSTQVPEDYSIIVTHPFNRYDLPFLTLTGIVDADRFTHSHSLTNLPFLLRNDFEGMIKKGTPMYQVIPFKRENWKSEQAKTDNLEIQKSVTSVRQYFWNGYKKLFWSKKEYK